MSKDLKNNNVLSMVNTFRDIVKNGLEKDLEKDLEKAIYWFNKAAENGDVIA